MSTKQAAYDRVLAAAEEHGWTVDTKTKFAINLTKGAGP